MPEPVQDSTQAARARVLAHQDCLRLDPATRQDTSRRLKSAKGHLEGVLRMLEDPDVYCVDMLKQIKAVQGALSKINEGVLRSHIRDHVATAAQRGDTEHIVDELMEALKYRA
ncbi:metal-sensitive transcriptional regulator CsoR [soil metagenome]